MCVIQLYSYTYTYLISTHLTKTYSAIEQLFYGTFYFRFSRKTDSINNLINTPTTLSIICKLVSSKLPLSVVIAEGTGRAADVLAYGLANIGGDIDEYYINIIPEKEVPLLEAICNYTRKSTDRRHMGLWNVVYSLFAEFKSKERIYNKVLDCMTKKFAVSSNYYCLTHRSSHSLKRYALGCAYTCLPWLNVFYFLHFRTDIINLDF